MLRKFGVVGAATWVVCSAPLVSQHLSYGIVAGTALTNDFQSSYFECCPGSGFSQLQAPAGKSAFVGGPKLEWDFSRHFSLEANALYRELHYDNLDPAGPRDAVVSWEFPILAKYRLSYYRIGSVSVRPFVEAGPSFRATGNLNQSNPSHRGVTAGAGFEFPVRKVLIAPALRYTRWAADANYLALSRPDQLELVVGFSAAAKMPRGLRAGRRLSFGAVMGVNLLGDYSSSTSTFLSGIIIAPATPSTVLETDVRGSGGHSFMIGPELEVHLTKSASIELGAIFRPIRERVSVSYGPSLVALMSSTGVSSTTTWQFPVLAKYLWPGNLPTIGELRPFVEAGLTYRSGPSVLEAAGFAVVGLPRFGFTAGAGVSRRLGPLKLAPGVRYTRWQTNDSGLKPDEANLLLGVTF